MREESLPLKNNKWDRQMNTVAPSKPNVENPVVDEPLKFSPPIKALMDKILEIFKNGHSFKRFSAQPLGKSESSTICIDADFGAGKTTFCTMLQEEIEAKAKEYKVIYVDAFADDYMQDPLQSLLSQMLPPNRIKKQKN